MSLKKYAKLKIIKIVGDSITTQPNLADISYPQPVLICLPYGAVNLNKLKKVITPIKIQTNNKFSSMLKVYSLFARS